MLWSRLCGNIAFSHVACDNIDNVVNKKPEEMEKHDIPAVEVVQPAEKDHAEAPQIKGPVDVPERKKAEEAQLDRPNAGREINQSWNVHWNLISAQSMMFCLFIQVLLCQRQRPIATNLPFLTMKS